MKSEEIFARVEFDTNGGCWLWPGCEVAVGYRAMQFEGKQRPAHRVSWIAHNGPIPDGLYVCHKCDVRACVNPDHLFLGTHSDNMRDMFAKGRGRQKLTPAQVSEIRAAYDPTPSRRGRINPNSKAQIAKRYGVSRFAVADIIKGKRWGHLLNPQPQPKD